ncbi:catalase family protein [Lyngbya confervoides]|uniref:Catalase family protein n=1 Tax=Lyngbya confervoides BDU141951 TaxID=1574623 RepID=A0ABD4T8N1_9CYAN|nr:catalase family protein [Lyngbya confervoides]MCM1984799.1 catalase family protein [Lyngbya confervoides BDU141951]
MSNKPELGQEYPLPNEAADIQRITEISAQQIQDQYSQEGSPARRDQHPKNHGVVWANFTIDPDLPAALRVGLFKQPGKCFPAWIRYSNGQAMDDRQGGSHGMAIKLMAVEGTKALEDDSQTHDLVMIDHPVFFIRTIPDYVDLFERSGQMNRTSASPGSRLQAFFPFFFPSLWPGGWRLQELRRFLVLGGLKKIIKPASPLNCSYFSVTPYQLGAGKAVKFLVKPHANNRPDGVDQSTPDYLRQAMIKTLSQRAAGFDFFLQVQTNPLTMPVEDSTILWRSPPIKVATVDIPPQTFDSPAQMSFCENLSFTPWHALLEQRPLGSMNRARRQVYQQTAEVRHQLNQAPLEEPGPDTFSPTLLSLDSPATAASNQ